MALESSEIYIEVVGNNNF